MRSPREARDKIFRALQDVYNPNVKGDWWSATDNYPTGVNKVLTVDILSAIVGVLTYDGDESAKRYMREDFRQEVQNLIWSVYTGGGLAEHITDRIFKELKLDSLFPKE